MDGREEVEKVRGVFEVLLSTTYGTSTCVLYTLHLEDAVGEVTIVLIVPRTGPLRAEYIHICIREQAVVSSTVHVLYPFALTHSSTYPLTYPLTHLLVPTYQRSSTCAWKAASICSVL